MKHWIRSAGLWHQDLSEAIGDSVKTKKTDLSCDIIFLEGNHVLHIIDKCTGWSVMHVLKRRSLSEQAKAFNKMQIYRHGVPKTIQCDREYTKCHFQEMCDEYHIKINAVAENDLRSLD